MTVRAGSRPRHRPFVLLMLAIALVAFVLRGPIVAVAPVVTRIQDDLLLTAAQSGLLTSIPVLCFGLLTPLAFLVIGRLGADAAITVSVVGVAIGTVIRSSDGVGLALAGTAVIGAAVTIGNVVLPVVIRRDFPPERVGLATGIYTAALNIGTTITSLATAPLADLLGWRLALVVWTSFSVAALLAWMLARGIRPALVPKRVEPVALVTGEMPAVAPRVWRSMSVVLLILAFSGQSFSYYGVTAWLPTILIDENGFSAAAAGAGSSLFQIAAVVGALGVPLLIARLTPLGTFLVVGALWVSVPIGLVVAPDLWGLWCSLGGVAQGGGITVVFVVIVRLARSDLHASRLSATVQGVSYAVAATAPAVVGLGHDLSGGWTAPMMVVLGALLVFVGAGAASAVRVRRA